MSADPVISVKNRCQHVNQRGVPCGLSVRSNAASDGAAPLCRFHRNRTTELCGPDTPVSQSLLRGVGRLDTAASVNRFMANLLKETVRQRIPRQEAITLGYLSQLLMGTLPSLKREREDALDLEGGQLLLRSLMQPRADNSSESNASSAACNPSAGIRPGYTAL